MHNRYFARSPLLPALRPNGPLTGSAASDEAYIEYFRTKAGGGYYSSSLIAGV